MRIGSKANLLIISVVAALFVPLSGLLVRFQRTALRQVYMKTVDRAADDTSLLLDGFARESRRSTEALAAFITPEDLRGPGLRGLAARIRKLNQEQNFRDGILVLDRHGTVLLDPLFGSEMTGRSLAGYPFFRRTLAERRGIISDPYESPRTRKPVVTFTAPVLSGRGTVLAVVACTYDLLGPGLLETLRERKVGLTGYVYLADRTRMLVLHPDFNRMLQRDVPPGANPAFDAAVQGYTGFRATANAEGVPILASYQPVYGTPWVLVAQVPEAEAYATIHNLRRLILLSTGASLLVILATAVVAVRWFTRPIQRLHRVVQGIAAAPGDQDPDTAVLADLQGIPASSDEMGDFTRAFQDLVNSKGRALRLLHQAADEWERTFDAVFEAILCLDGQGRILRINRAAADLFRIPARLASKLDGRALVYGSGEPAEAWPDPGALDPERPFSWTGPLPGHDGMYEFLATPMAWGEASKGMLLTIRDITEQTRRAEHMHRQAFFDHLTGLPNRIMLMDRLEQALARCARSGHPVAVLFLDLDRFKQVNDTLGHAAGDALLRTAAARMSAMIRKNDTLARLGGDEFVLVLSDLQRPEDAALVADKLVQALQAPFAIEGEPVQIGASIGLALAPSDGLEAAALLEKADLAMYQAKRGGRSAYRLFSN